ncbi:glutamyl endopeptidase [Colletotrichum truncatum]|uniref:Glutamyl endopeptidase n=1 Tax=Colletotrichum truncatum TaxID=5467 RepID=A0ACC3YW09_COLTU|nr:glutamyl endopeptidase [Colletotrichum truncatum]KAF6791136.1 glutamyl endopeptidase [Colletotrichum truncatum]
MMFRLNGVAAVAALCLSPLAFGVPTPEDASSPPNDILPLIGFDATPVPSLKARGSPEIVPEVVSVSLSELQDSNITEFAPPFPGPSESSKRGIIGPDNRVLWTNKEYPYRAMGRIEFSNGLWCSGALIGSRHVATARHCIPASGVSARFQPAYDNGEPYGGYPVSLIVHAEYGQTGWCANAYDWAIFVLAEKAGTANGWLGLKIVNPDNQLNRAMFFHYGYPQDKGGRRPYRQEGITASAATGCDRGSPVVTDTDSIGGQSGGPFWINENGNRYLYGIHVGGSDTLGVVAGGQSFLNAYGNLLKDYPN